MRRFRHFSISSVSLFLCSIFIVTALAQEKLTEIVKKIEPSTVVILTYGKEGKMIGQGSGFFISQSGDIITNGHVLNGVHRAEVKTARGKVYPIMMIVGEDKEADIIRVSVNIPIESIHPISISRSIPEVGERVAVIGNPLGLERTVSDGIVSAVREIPAFGKVYQITAPISPGSSGSPVVNMKGEVIGVATFQFVEGQNLNFAIPGERIARLKTEKGKTLDQWKMGKTEANVAQPQNYDFRHTKWGMSMQEVKERENGEPIDKFSKGDVLIFTSTLLDEKVLVVYTFAFNKLVRAKYMFAKYSDSLWRVFWRSFPKEKLIAGYLILDFEKFKKELTEKYGEPLEERWPLYKDYHDLLKGEEGLEVLEKAIKERKAGLFAKWMTDKTNILLAVFGEEGQIQFAIDYRSRKLERLEKKNGL